MFFKTENLIGIAEDGPLSDHFQNPACFQSAVNAALFRAKKLNMPVLVINDGGNHIIMRHGQPLGRFLKGRRQISAAEVDTDGRITRVTASLTPIYSL